MLLTIWNICGDWLINKIYILIVNDYNDLYLNLIDLRKYKKSSIQKFCGGAPKITETMTMREKFSKLCFDTFFFHIAMRSIINDLVLYSKQICTKGTHAPPPPSPLITLPQANWLEIYYN